MLVNKRWLGMSQSVITKLVEFFPEFIRVHDKVGRTRKIQY